MGISWGYLILILILFSDIIQNQVPFFWCRNLRFGIWLVWLMILICLTFLSDQPESTRMNHQMLGHPNKSHHLEHESPAEWTPSWGSNMPSSMHWRSLNWVNWNSFRCPPNKSAKWDWLKKYRPPQGRNLWNIAIPKLTENYFEKPIMSWSLDQWKGRSRGKAGFWQPKYQGFIY
jgi:hypothetical protein